MNENKRTLVDYLLYFSNVDFLPKLLFLNIEGKSLDYYLSQVLTDSNIVYIQKDAIKTIYNYLSTMKLIKKGPVLMIVQSKVIEVMLKLSLKKCSEFYVWFFFENGKIYFSWNGVKKALNPYKLFLLFFLIKKNNKNKYFICSKLIEE